MILNYRCLKCNKWRTIEWANREKILGCPDTKQDYVPPTPGQQNDAYVDTREWPNEMEQVVVSNKGRNCTVPGCNKAYETLDHRLAWSKGGKTSVKNLFPMCTVHNESKGDTAYYVWLVNRIINL